MSTLYNGEIYDAMGAIGIKPKDPKRMAKIDAIMKDPNYVLQRKLNGERVTIYRRWSGLEIFDYNTEAYGRGESKYGGRMEKTGLIPHIIAEVQEFLPNGSVLDGEVLWMSPKLSITEIDYMEFTEDFWKCRAVMANHLNPEQGVDVQEKSGKLHYFIFDLLAFDGATLVNEPYITRLDILLNKAASYIGPMDYVHIVPVEFEEDKKRALLEYCISIGLEGCVAKRLDKPYFPGKKPAGVWVKLKKSDKADGFVIGYSPAEQYTEIRRNGKKLLGPDGKCVLAESRFYTNGWIGAIWMGQWSAHPPTKAQLKDLRDMDYHGEMCRIIDDEMMYLVPVAKISGMTDAIRREVSEDKNGHLDKLCAFAWFDKTPECYFQPTFSHFRTDKKKSECIWE